MKKILSAIIFLMLSFHTMAQQAVANTQSWFEKNVKISQSMETAEKKEEPAQFQITIPKTDSSSWLINIGISVAIKSKSANWLSKLTGEYHKNTLTDEKQNNVLVGYKALWLFSGKNTLDHFIEGDLKYVYDGELIKHSVASNILYTFLTNNGMWNRTKYNSDNSQSMRLSLHGGIQMQHTFQAKTSQSKGFIARPVFNFALYYNLNRKQAAFPPDPALQFSLDYTGRTDAINSTGIKENYTHLLKAGADWFLAYKPVRVSLGASFNYGSDPLKGLAKQQFWLLSINIFKG